MWRLLRPHQLQILEVPLLLIYWKMEKADKDPELPVEEEEKDEVAPLEDNEGDALDFAAGKLPAELIEKLRLVNPEAAA